MMRSAPVEDEVTNQQHLPGTRGRLVLRTSIVDWNSAPGLIPRFDRSAAISSTSHIVSSLPRFNLQ